MRLFTDNAGQYLGTLSTALKKDPSSFAAWNALHVHLKDHCSLNQQVLSRLKEEHGQHDCDVVLLDGKEMLLISRGMTPVELENFAASLIPCELEQAPELVHANLCQDWQAVSRLLTEKQLVQEAHAAAEEQQPALPAEVSSLRSVFVSTTQHRRSRRSHYVMIVEDDPMTRRMVSHAFKDRYAVISAANAHEALTNYLLYAPDIVFLDIGLPDGNGFDVLASIQATDPEAYVVMFSGNSYLDNVTNALSHGAQGFIAKPFRKENMQRYIEDSMLHHQKAAV